ncbi:MAG: TRAP transporter small permease subunit [Deltaproteobacteria bacterium]|nr:TRAP transporter small permease subunit [Deltaproteobacteria bacterium]
MRILDCIDNISLWSGKILLWLAVILSAVVLYEVFARYCFNSPTDWGFDVAMMIYSTFFMGGAAYIQLKKGHIRVDVILNMLSSRTQAIIELVNLVIIIFPFAFVMVWFGTKVAILSMVGEEISNTSQWGEIIWPWRFMIPLAFLLFLLQSIADFIRIVKSLRRQ